MEIVAISACFESDVVNMKRQSSDFNECWAKLKRPWPNLLPKRVENFSWEAFDKGGKGTIMVESCILVRWKSTITARTVLSQVQAWDMRSLTFMSALDSTLLSTSTASPGRCLRGDPSDFLCLSIAESIMWCLGSFIHELCVKLDEILVLCHQPVLKLLQARYSRSKCSYHILFCEAIFPYLLQINFIVT